MTYGRAWRSADGEEEQRSILARPASARDCGPVPAGFWWRHEVPATHAERLWAFIDYWLVEGRWRQHSLRRAGKTSCRLLFAGSCDLPTAMVVTGMSAFHPLRMLAIYGTGPLFTLKLLALFMGRCDIARLSGAPVYQWREAAHSSTSTYFQRAVRLCRDASTVKN